MLDSPVFIAIGAACILAGLSLLIIGLRGDPSRERRRCRKCWHSMDGLTPDAQGQWTCPECGIVAERERLMLKRRRFKRISILGVLVLLLPGALVYGALVNDRARSEGWTAIVPTTLLAFFSPDHIDDDTNGSAFEQAIINALVTRTPRMFEWQISLVDAPEIPIAKRPLSQALVLPAIVIEEHPVPFALRSLNLSGGGAEEVIRAPGHVGASVVSYADRWRIAWGFGGSGGGYGAGVLDPDAHVRGTGEVVVECVLSRDTPFRYSKTIRERVPFTVPSAVSREDAVAQARTLPAFLTRTGSSIDDWLLNLPWLYIVRVGNDVGLVIHDQSSRHTGIPSNPHAVDLVIEVQLIDRDGQVVFCQLYRNHPTSSAASSALRCDSIRFSDPHGTVMRSKLAMEHIIEVSTEAFEDRLRAMRVRLIPRPDLAMDPGERDEFWVPAGDAWYLEMTLEEAIERSRTTPGWLDPFGRTVSEYRERLRFWGHFDRDQ